MDGKKRGRKTESRKQYIFTHQIRNGKMASKKTRLSGNERYIEQRQVEGSWNILWKKLRFCLLK